MRESLRDIDRLQHIRERIDNVMSFLEGKTFEDMKSNVMCYHAVVHNIMIIGEAANLLTKDFRDRHSEVPWRDIIDMRNVLVHGFILPVPFSFGRRISMTCQSYCNRCHHRKEGTSCPKQTRCPLPYPLGHQSDEDAVSCF